MQSNTNITDYNNFCKEISEGSILYNIDKTNHWGEYFLVVDVSTIKIDDLKTYSLLLLGLKKTGESFIPKNTRIRITPDFANNIPFLKCVGRCSFNLNPEISNINVNNGLIVIYENVDLHKYSKKLHVRKPKARKYSIGGELIKFENQ